MSAPERYRVTLECGHMNEWTWKPESPAWRFFCPTCGKPGYIKCVELMTSEPAPEPPRSLWTRLLGWIIDRIYGPWRG